VLNYSTIRTRTPQPLRRIKGREWNAEVCSAARHARAVRVGTWARVDARGGFRGRRGSGAVATGSDAGGDAGADFEADASGDARADAAADACTDARADVGGGTEECKHEWGHEEGHEAHGERM
jgi:hypothetical protein